jgi:hypothetical protein
MTEKGASGRAPAWSFVGQRVADALADVPDARDQLFQPALQPLPPRLLPFKDEPPWWNPNRIRHQGHKPSCVGHALAAVIDHMRAAALVGFEKSASALKTSIKTTLGGPFVSSDMLYSMAQFHDEWSGEDYSGSSIRGGLKGFFYNGVCSEAELSRRPTAPVKDMTPVEASTWFMTKTLAEEARTIQLGAYYRVRPRLPDMHAALNEANALVVSATIHDGWKGTTAVDSKIRFSDRPLGGAGPRQAMHAFAVVGYDEVGFWIQNSWGRSWGRQGLAHWSYEDWAANVVDAWVLRLAILPPDSGASVRRGSRLTAYGSKVERPETHFLGRTPVDSSGPSRLDILGHLVPFRDGVLDRQGPYNVNRQTLSETFRLIQTRYADGRAPPGRGNYAPPGVALKSEDRKYRHVLIYFLGGWPDENRLAADIADVVPTFTELGIYPFFVSFDTPMFRELNFVIRRAIDEVARLTRDTPSARRLVRDRLIEGRIALPGNRLLRDLRLSARRVFLLDQPDPDYAARPPACGQGAHSLARLFEELAPYYRDKSLDFHVAAHGFGAQLLVECLAQQKVMHAHASFTSCTLVSPLVASHRIGHSASAEANSLYDCLVPRGESIQRRRPADRIGIERLRLFTLSARALRVDRFSDDYGQSWPLLWSYVMGLDPASIAMGQSVEGDMIGEDARQRYRSVPLLGLPKEADAFVRTARRDGLNVSALEVVSDEDQVDSSLHHELGFHRGVLGKIVDDILGTASEGTFRGNGRKIEFHDMLKTVPPVG